jgi:DNA mismatch endonuclease (patch repair protein)
MKRDPKVTSRIMSAIKSKNTKPELLLGKALWCRGLRYRKHYKTLEGSPDFVFLAVRVAVFCDGDFWHGNNWRLRNKKSLEEELGGYPPLWREKILGNIERDIRVNRNLTALGWTILRFWASEIIADTDGCVRSVEAVVNGKKAELAKTKKN